MGPQLTYIVCAVSSDEAQAWARRYGIPWKRVIIATPRSAWIEGAAHFAVVRRPGFFTLPPDVQERIEAAIGRNERRAVPLTSRTPQ